jgi:hypothetical protein
VLQRHAHAELVRQRIAARQLSGGQGRRHLSQGEGIAPGALPQKGADLRCRCHARSLDEQCIAGHPVQACHGELRQAGDRVPPGVRFRGGEEQGDPLRVHTPGHENQCVHRLGVEPLDVIHDAQQRLMFGEFGEQAQDRQRDQEPVAALGGNHAQRPFERGRLQGWDGVKVTEGRPKELMQRGERQSGL